MNNQFSIAQRVGLMFRYDQELPQDMETWIKAQLNAPSPALGIANTNSRATVVEWPDELQPDLSKRVHLWRRYRDLKRQERERKNGQDTEAAKQANRRENKMRKR